MIGILLALQVNNWNEGRKRKSEEIEFLTDFKYDLKNDLQSLDMSIAYMNTSKASMNFILDYMKKDLPWHDSLKYHFGNIGIDWPVFYNYNTFNSITSRDWTIVRNKELREALLGYYAYLNTDQKPTDQFTDELFEVSRNVWNTRFEGFWESNYEEWKNNNNYLKWDNFNPEQLVFHAIPLNFELIKSDQEYRYSLIRLRNFYNWYREMSSNNNKLKAENLLKAIEEELIELER